jgi:Holliday junction resolvase
MKKNLWKALSIDCRCKKQRKCYQNVKKLINFSSKKRIKLWIIIMVKKKQSGFSFSVTDRRR